MLIKALKSFSDGTISPCVDEVVDVTNARAEALISEGLAAAYTEPIIPTGSMDITENGTYDVTKKASVVVNVPTTPVEQGEKPTT